MNNRAITITHNQAVNIVRLRSQGRLALLGACYRYRYMAKKHSGVGARRFGVNSNHFRGAE